MKWIKSQDSIPDSQIPCIVTRRDMGMTSVYPKFAEWDGNEWVDIDGDPVTGVIAWRQAPVYDSRLENALEKLKGCINNDKCEQRDCCYFVALDLIEELLKYYKGE